VRLPLCCRATVKERQAQDPNFSFLFPHGPEHAYWQWALYCAIMATPPTQAPAAAPPHYQQQQQQVPAPTPPSSMQLPPEMEAGFAQVLEALSGSKVSFKAKGRCGGCSFALHTADDYSCKFLPWGIPVLPKAA